MKPLRIAALLALLALPGLLAGPLHHASAHHAHASDAHTQVAAPETAPHPDAHGTPGCASCLTRTQSRPATAAEVLLAAPPSAPPVGLPPTAQVRPSARFRTAPAPPRAPPFFG